MNVEQLMTRDVQCCRPEDTLARAAQLMWDRDCGTLPVCEGESLTQLVGMITDRDVTMSALFRGRPLHEISVSDAMTRDPRACRPEDSAEDAERTMRDIQVRRLPVVSASGELVGIISLADIAREAAREAAASPGASPAQEVSEVEVGDTLARIVQPGQASGASGIERTAGAPPL